MIDKISVNGFRGFSIKQEIEFAKPNGKEGSGLTMIVGSNNSGKSTVLELFKYYKRQSPENVLFSKEKRNHKSTEFAIEFTSVEESNSHSISLPNMNDSVAKSTFENSGSQEELKIPYYLPSRRIMEPEFGFSNYSDVDSRNNYARNSSINSMSRTSRLNYFESRIFKWYSVKEKFDKLLYEILETDLQWTIDTRENGQSYISFDGVHSIEGVGDGIWSIFTIVDSLFDSSANSIIVIDEPEISIHPQLQRNIMKILMEYSKDRQIIYGTHSPYFLNWRALENGAHLVRVFQYEGSTNVKQLTSEFSYNRSITSSSHPHTFGINANETFFLDDKIIVLEGQEDVICYQLIEDHIKFKEQEKYEGCQKQRNYYNYYGWGANGADSVEFLLGILTELGYKKVVVILDGDKAGIDAKEILVSKFSDYKILNISADDIRDKNDEKKGVLSKKFTIKPDFDVKFGKEFRDLFVAIDKYFEE